ncbi:transposase, partial [Youngiibacter fragilis]|uniref:transposase n=1 Tax=Youngiibacter fragilis TaxID=1408819 RepID=UPI001FA7B0B1
MIAIKEKSIDVIAMAKKSSKLLYLFEGNKMSAMDIYRMCKKRRGRSKYLLSVEVSVQKDGQSLPVRLVFVRNRNKSKDYLVLVSTNVTISESEVIRIYGKRWDIEVFFKVCKSYLNLSGSFKGLSYDAQMAHVAIVFTRYTLLAIEQRFNNDDRSLGELFYLVCDELSDISFEH